MTLELHNQAIAMLDMMLRPFPCSFLAFLQAGVLISIMVTLLRLRPLKQQTKENYVYNFEQALPHEWQNIPAQTINKLIGSMRKWWVHICD